MIRLRTLGECTIQVADKPIGPESEILFALVLYLGSARGKRITRSEIMSLLWPQCSESNARHRLRQGLYQLRRLGAPVSATMANVLLNEADIWLDYAQPPKHRRKLLQDLAMNSAVDFLPGYHPDISEPFSRWLEAQRDSVRALLRQDLEAVLFDERTQGDLTPIVQLARACIELDPLNHNATLALAEAQAALGNGEESVAILDRYCSEIRALSPA